MRRKRTTQADTAAAQAQPNEPNQWRELLKVALLATAFVGSYATGAALSPVAPVSEAATARPPPQTVLCPTHLTVVLPSVVNAPKRTQRLQAIAETWGAAARAVFVVTTPSKWSALPEPAPCAGYPYSLQVPTTINNELGVERLRWVLAQMALSKASHIFMVNDHTAVIAENLVCFLKAVDPTRPAYAGRALAQKRGKSTEIFNSGAAGYVLTQPSLALVEKHWGTAPCNAKKTEKWLQGNPGLVLARCLQRHGVKAIDTQKDGHRFHAYGPVRVATKEVDDWYLRMNSQLPWASSDTCSPDAVTFHYVEAPEQRSIYDALRTADLDEVMERWPKAPSDLGGYSRHWRNPVQRSQVRALLSSLTLAAPGSC